jgi:bifunctional DNase/RNase
MLVQMEVQGVMFDASRGVYILVLRGVDGDGVLPVRIEKADAQSIGLAFEGVFTQRPLTHDLCKNILDALEAKMISAVISSFSQETYYAKIHLVYRDSEFAIDARPGDAVSLALRVGVPIFVNEDVVQQQSAEELDRWLEHLSPEDFGKYNV